MARKHDAKGRSKGDGQYIPISHRMAKSDAWRSLSGPAVKLYVELRSRYNGRNNGDLSVSLDEAARLLNMGKTTAQRAYQELEAKGFIVMTKRGQWYGRLATTWRVTDRPCRGHLSTNDWQRWQNRGE